MSDEARRKPEWSREKTGSEFASYVMPAAAVPADPFAPEVMAKLRGRRRPLPLEDFVAGFQRQDRSILARAITLVESNHTIHQAQAQKLLEALPSAGNETRRIGLTGVPGAGKSTLVEALGEKLCAEGHRVAVLAVDPSSSLSRGSILGDKTRMEKLARNPSAFIRPSPTGGCLGGVARKTRETLQLCEAFGFDIIILETVGVGQSEVAVRSMVDIFLLLSIAGAGDDLQGIKKGVIELADAIVVNKADGDNRLRAKRTRSEYERVLHFLQPATEGWTTPALTISALTGEGLDQLWETVDAFYAEVQASGLFERRRRGQNLEWLRSLIDEALRDRFYRDPEVARRLEALQPEVASGEVTPVEAVRRLFTQ